MNEKKDKGQGPVDTIGLLVDHIKKKFEDRGINMDIVLLSAPSKEKKPESKDLPTEEIDSDKEKDGQGTDI